MRMKMCANKRGRRQSAALSLLLAAGALLTEVPGAASLEEAKDEPERLKACERQLCGIIVGRRLNGNNLKCALQKTWASTSIKDGIQRKRLIWSMGDARCQVDIELSRATIVAALILPEYKFAFPKRTIACQIEDGKDVIPVRVSLAPTVQFQRGRAVKAWLGVEKVEAPVMLKTAIWTAATLEDSVGLFHSEILKGINSFVHEKCPGQYGAVSVARKKATK